MKEKLKNYFPTIREREELLLEIQENVILQDLYAQLSPELKEELLNFCTGMKGLKILRDSFFKISCQMIPQGFRMKRLFW